MVSQLTRLVPLSTKRLIKLLEHIKAESWTLHIAPDKDEDNDVPVDLTNNNDINTVSTLAQTSDEVDPDVLIINYRNHRGRKIFTHDMYLHITPSDRQELRYAELIELAPRLLRELLNARMQNKKLIDKLNKYEKAMGINNVVPFEK